VASVAFVAAVEAPAAVPDVFAELEAVVPVALAADGVSVLPLQAASSATAIESAAHEAARTAGTRCIEVSFESELNAD
jgi:hypothetical protein